MMVSLFLRTNQLMFLIPNFFVVIMYYPSFLIVLVLSLNIWKLKFSILIGHTESLILPSWTFLPSVVLFFVPRNHGNTWVSFLIGNSHSINILTTTLTRLSLWLSVWSFWGIQCKKSILSKNTYYIDAASSLLCYMVSNFGFTTKLLFHITWKFWGKCKEEPQFGF